MKRTNTIENGVNCFKFEVTTGHLDLKIGPSDNANNLQATVLAIEPKYFIWGFILGRGGTLLKMVYIALNFEVTTGHLDLEIGPSDIVNNLQATVLA